MTPHPRRYALSIGSDQSKMDLARQCFSDEHPDTVVVNALDRIDAMIKLYRQQFDFLVCELSSKESEGYILIDSLKSEEDKVRPKSSLLLCDRGQFPELTKFLGETFIELPSPFTVEELKAALLTLLNKIEENEKKLLNKTPQIRSGQESIVNGLLSAYSKLNIENNLKAKNFNPGKIHWNEFQSDYSILVFPFKCKFGRGQIKISFLKDSIHSIEDFQTSLAEAWNSIRTIIPSSQFSSERGSLVTGDSTILDIAAEYTDYSFVIVCEKSSMGLDICFSKTSTY